MDGLTPVREMPGAVSQLCSLLKAHVQQGLGTGLCFRLPLAPRLERKTKHSWEKISIGDPRDVLSCALQYWLRERVSQYSRTGMPWKRFKFQSLVRLVEYGPSPRGLGMELFMLTALRTIQEPVQVAQGCHHVPLNHWVSPLILTPPVSSVAHTKDSSSQTQVS